jgi:hypothetical protein
MKITQHVNFGLREMLYPFRQWLKDVGSYSVIIRPCDATKNAIKVNFKFHHKNIPFTEIEIPDNEEIRFITDKYYNECCLSDLIYNILLEPVVFNMQTFGLKEITEEF